jgi:hypothetical protein
MTSEAFQRLAIPLRKDCGQERQAVQIKVAVSEQVVTLGLMGFFTCQNPISQIQR